MHKALLLFLAGVAGPASGQTVSVGPCRGENNFIRIGSPAVVCEVTNGSETAIASLTYSARAVQDGRTVPWAVIGENSIFPSVAAVPGGIEPGETVPVEFRVTSLPERANKDLIRWEVTIVQVRHVDGAIIPEPDAEVFADGEGQPEDPGPPMTSGERDAFRVAVQGCWVVDPGS